MTLATIETLPNFGQRVTARRTASQGELEMVVDIFAGAGGASLGIEAALGCAVDKAINHNPLMIQMHEANHPATKHLPGNVWDYKPLQVTEGRPVGLLWASPDCTHFSRAKGGRPVSKKIRALAWVVTKWAREVKPRVIILENVPEFVTWGPLGPDHRPIASRRGETFKRWLGQLKRLGYVVEHCELIAADYGVPTIRKRFFLIARCDGQPIRWPEQTHGKVSSVAVRENGVDFSQRKSQAGARMSAAGGAGHGRKLKPWRSAAECIDWELPCPSIFERKRPLAEATLRRIAKGIGRYVIENPRPFIVPTGYGERRGQAPRTHDIMQPLSTIVGSTKQALCTPFVVTCNHAGSGHIRSAENPMRTLTASRDAHGVIAPSLISIAQYRQQDGQARSIEQPLSTVTANPKGGHHALVTALLAGCGGRAGQSRPRGADEPMATITGKADTCLGVAHLQTLYGTSKDGKDITQPMPTVTGQGNHIAEVRAFLIAYYGNSKGDSGGDLLQPMGTVVSRDRFGLVTVDGQDYAIADIGLRMLTPRELLRAQFGRFAADYVLIGTQAQQVAGIGNSVPPELAEQLVRCNVRLQRVPRSEVA